LIKKGKIRPFICIKVTDELKWCSKCGEIKKLSDFNKNKSRKDGLNDWCGVCRTTYQREQRRKGPIEREIKYGQSDKGKKASQKSISNYRKTEKYKISWMKSNNKNRISSTISSRMRQSLHGCKYNRHWEELVDYTLNDLKEHLSSLFLDGMNWENHGKGGWNIDHIKPIRAFNITSYDCSDFKLCWSLNNLQPLWELENQSKGAKYKGIDYRYEII